MNGPWNSQMRTIHTNTRKHRNCRWLRRCERGGGGWGWVIMYKVVVQSSPRLPCTTGGSVRTKYRPCLFSGFPKVGTRSLLSSSAVKKLTHLAEHPPTAAPTPTHRHTHTLGKSPHSPQDLGRPLFPGQLSRFLL